MYDETIAIHYAAYRPPVHEIILNRVLGDDYIATAGLDIGCGTGRSSIALKKYCDHVIGIDPGEQMLRNAREFDDIEYMIASGEKLPLGKETMDIVTLAGSINYMDRMLLIDEINRVCVADAIVLVYDFDVDLDNIEACLNLDIVDDSFAYDHSANLGESQYLQLQLQDDDVVSLQASSSEIAHLLLSDKASARALHQKYRSQDVFTPLEADIARRKSTGSINIKIYYASYLVIGRNGTQTGTDRHANRDRSI
jgi:SAM-dependent methyltransferase